MTSSIICGHTPFWTWNPILDISETGRRLVRKIPWLDSQKNSDTGSDVIEYFWTHPLFDLEPHPGYLLNQKMPGDQNTMVRFAVKF